MRNGSFKITNSWLLFSGFRFGAADAVEPWWIREPQKETPYWLWQQAHWVQARWWGLEILHGSSVSPAPFSSAALKDTNPQNCQHLRKNSIFHYCEVSFCLEESNPLAVGQLLNCKRTLSFGFFIEMRGSHKTFLLWLPVYWAGNPMEHQSFRAQDSCQASALPLSYSPSPKHCLFLMALLFCLYISPSYPLSCLPNGPF